jgi:hypothetical protein
MAKPWSVPYFMIGFLVDGFPWSYSNYFQDFVRNNDSVDNSVAFDTVTSQAVQFFFQCLAAVGVLYQKMQSGPDVRLYKRMQVTDE